MRQSPAQFALFAGLLVLVPTGSGCCGAWFHARMIPGHRRCASCDEGIVLPHAAGAPAPASGQPAPPATAGPPPPPTIRPPHSKFHPLPTQPVFLPPHLAALRPRLLPVPPAEAPRLKYPQDTWTDPPLRDGPIELPEPQGGPPARQRLPQRLPDEAAQPAAPAEASDPSGEPPAALPMPAPPPEAEPAEEPSGEEADFRVASPRRR